MTLNEAAAQNTKGANEMTTYTDREAEIIDEPIALADTATVDRERVLTALRGLLSQYQAAPHSSNGPVAGAIAALGQAIREVEKIR